MSVSFLHLLTSLTLLTTLVPAILTSATMPRGQESKLRAQDKCRQAQSETHGPGGVQVTSAAGEEYPRPSLLFLGVLPASGTAQDPQGAPLTTTAAAGVSYTNSDNGARSQDEESTGTSQVPAPRGHLQRSCKQEFRTVGAPPAYKMKETTVKAALLRPVKGKHKAHFLQLLTSAADRMNRSAALTGRKSTPLTPPNT